MALGLNTGSNGNGGSYLPIVKFDARSGRMIRVDRFQDGQNGWSSKNEDITFQHPQFAVDFRSIEVGWAAFSATGPDFKMVPLGNPLPVKPSENHKQGFKVKLYGPTALGGAREFSTTSKCVLAALDELHTIYEAAPEAAEGKLPVVKLTGSEAVTTKGPSGTTTNYKPTLEVVAWVDRPAELGEATVPLPVKQGSAPVPQAAPPAPSQPAPTAVTAQAGPPPGMPF